MAKKPSTIVSITEFTSDLKEKARCRPGHRAKVRIFCETCKKYHYLHWGEFQNALGLRIRKPHNIGYGKPDPKSLQDIVDFYKKKYCRS